MTTPMKESATAWPASGPAPSDRIERDRIEQDRLARAGLAGEHAEACPEVQVERFDQHDVANGERGQHRAKL